MCSPLRIIIFACFVVVSLASSCDDFTCTDPTRTCKLDSVFHKPTCKEDFYMSAPCLGLKCKDPSLICTEGSSQDRPECQTNHWLDFECDERGTPPHLDNTGQPTCKEGADSSDFCDGMMCKNATKECQSVEGYSKKIHCVAKPDLCASHECTDSDSICIVIQGKPECLENPWLDFECDERGTPPHAYFGEWPTCGDVADIKNLCDGMTCIDVDMECKTLDDFPHIQCVIKPFAGRDGTDGTDDTYTLGKKCIKETEKTDCPSADRKYTGICTNERCVCNSGYRQTLNSCECVPCKRWYMQDKKTCQCSPDCEDAKRRLQNHQGTIDSGRGDVSGAQLTIPLLKKFIADHQCE